MTCQGGAKASGWQRRQVNFGKTVSASLHVKSGALREVHKILRRRGLKRLSGWYPLCNPVQVKNAKQDWLIRLAFLLLGLGVGRMFIPAGARFATSEFREHDSAANSQSPGVLRPLGESKAEKAAPVATPLISRLDAKFELSLREPNPRKRITSFLNALDDMSAEEAPALKDLIAKLDLEGMQFPQEWNAFIRRWGEVDGAAAADYALSRAGELWVESGLREIFAGWAASDSAGSSNWLNAHGDDPNFDAALAGIVSGVAEKDPAEATRIALASTPEGEREVSSKLMEQLAEATVRQGQTSGMVAWFETLPGEGGLDSARRDAFPHVWSRLRHAGLEEAAAWLSTQADKPWRGDQQYSETMTAMAQKDPAAAVRWAASLPPSPVGGDWPGLNSAVGSWMAQNGTEVAAYVEAQPDTPFGQSVRQAYAAFTGRPQ